MCGIAGGVALHPDARPDADRVRRLSQYIAHRGPDGEGLWTSPSGRAVLAHRRLSIIDLATGQQPMMDDAGNIGLVFNGEIYNYKELRSALERQQRAFRTTSDTEVLLRSYEHAREECLTDLRGMFAFAIWDDQSSKLLLARDRIGKKPLYYCVDDGCVYFASSLHALSATSPRRLHVDTGAADAFLTLGYIPAPQTIYDGVKKLEAGTAVSVDSRTGRVSTRRYWSLANDAQPFAGSFDQAVDHLDDLLNTAVRLRLRSDVPLGVFLSGGIDSSLVAAIAARQAAIPITTFSIGFDVAAFDESGHAGRIATHLGTDHHVFRARPDLLAVLPDMVRHFGEPFADSSALPTWMLAERTRQHVTVALGGDGGDEGFAGYPWYRTAARLQTLTRGIPRSLFAVGRAFDGMLRPAAARSRLAGRARRGLLMMSIADPSERYASIRSFVGQHEVDTMYAGELLARRTNGHPGWTGNDLLASRYRASAGTDLRRMRYVDVETYLADCLMPKVDVATMAHALELRAPLLDQEVLRFALALPDEWLVDPRGDRDGKRLLRTLLTRYVPESLFDRPKQGFSVPLQRWFSGSVRDVISALPNSERLRATGWLRPEGMQLLVDEHLRDLRDHSQRLFNLMVLDEWLKQQ